MNLLESYKNRISIAESVYGKAHNGATMDSNRKMVVAKCLDSLNRYMTEAFESSSATLMSDLGAWKKFCLNLTNVALPNLIANELVIVYPMSSMTGYKL